MTTWDAAIRSKHAEEQRIVAVRPGNSRYTILTLPPSLATNVYDIGIFVIRSSATFGVCGGKVSAYGLQKLCRRFSMGLPIWAAALLSPWEARFISLAEFKIIYYPFMGTGFNTERLVLMARLCYAPIGVQDLKALVWGSEPDDKAVGKFVRGLVNSGHLGALEHWHTSFAVQDYSRISSQQNDRHRLMKMLKEPGVLFGGAAGETAAEGFVNDPEQSSPDVSQLQQSQRYVRETGFNYITPPSFDAHPEYRRKYEELQEQIRAMQAEGLGLGIPAEDVRFALSGGTETRFVITTNARQLRHMFNLRCCMRAQWEIRELFTGLLEAYREIAPNIFYRTGASCEELGYCAEGRMSCGKAATLDELLDKRGSPKTHPQ